MSAPTKEQIERLSKWAQDHIETLTRQRDEARHRADEVFESQKPTPFFTLDMVMVKNERGEWKQRPRYLDIQGSLYIEVDGVNLSLNVRESVHRVVGEDGTVETKPYQYVDLGWGERSWLTGKYGTPCVMHPSSHCRVHLVPVETYR